MNLANPNRPVLVLAALRGGWHFLWVMVVGIGWPEIVLNFVFWMHLLAHCSRFRYFRLDVRSPLLLSPQGATAPFPGGEIEFPPPDK